MRKGLAAFAVVMLGLIACLWLLKTKSEYGQRSPKSTAQLDAAVEHALATASPDASSAIASNFAAVPAPQTIFYSATPKPRVAPAGKPYPLQYTNLGATIVLDTLRHAIRDYAAMFGGNPVGLNSEITSQLNGKNPRQANFIKPDAGMRVNDRGELVDPWGTPYFFHQLSGTKMEIRSAGPDKTLWTADDLVAE